MSRKKKIVILSVMVLLLAATAVFNFVLSSQANVKKTDAALEAANYFVQYRSERSQSRSEQLIQLDEVISASADGETKNEALRMKLRLTDVIEEELLLEKLIKARGYDETVVSIGLTSENINVIVKDDDFTQDDAVIIYTILAQEADAAPDKVNIIPVN
ncbi:MAG: SpoIIIAH-like family protein [Clostridia bacterium]|nr:SpoIIIAH-like family protein [Clostridia bacterium]